MFENMKLGTKLVVSYLMVALIALTIGIIGIVSINEVNGSMNRIYNKDFLGLKSIKDAQVARLEVGRAWRNAMLEPDPDITAKNIKSVKDNLKLYKEQLEKSRELFYKPEAKVIFKELETATTEWEVLTLKMSDMILATNLMQRTPEFDAILKIQSPLGRSIDEKIEALVKIKQDAAGETVATANSVFKTSLIVMVVVIAVGFLVSIFIGLLFSRYLARQLGGELSDAVAQVKQVSAGNLHTSITLQPRDTSSLLYALRTMQETINGLILAQREMAQKHAEGFISYKIDTTKFQGEFSSMANEINTSVQAHIDIKMRVVDVVSEYARGDFAIDFDRLPNEKAKITETIDAVKHTLLGMSKEIKNLAEAGAKGDFSKRGNTDNFEFMFKDMLTNLNVLMETCDVGFNDVLRIANALAQGDLTQQITKDYQGTFGQTKDAINGTVENLKALVGEIKESSDTINTAAQEIAAGNNDLSHRTEEQAASLEETAASMQELTTTVQTNSENAKFANELAQASSNIARKGVSVVNQVVTTMEGINESSRKVVDIITVIDGIAFQTNILALNAAVEAARAGDQGRGFAVVATEVRSLAQRAAAAAGEIKNLISDSVEKVEDGSQLVARAGKTMEDIVNSIENVSKTISAITSASVEQNSGIQQVNQAIGQMDDVTQQNAALVEEAAAAAEALEDQARNLSVTVSNFKIDGIKMSVPAVKNYSKPATKSAAKPVASKPIATQKIEPVVSVPIETTAVIDIDLDGALKKHADWKVKLRTAITNKETLDAATISKDNCCDFGKWLHDEDSHQKIAHLPSYHDCITHHAAFHRAAGKVAEVINAKKYDEADKMLGQGSDFAKTSSDVGAMIMRLKKDIKPKPVKSTPAEIKAKATPVADLSDEWEEF